MGYYDEYKHLLGRPYISGSQDCYGLVRDYYRDVFSVNIVDAARPDGWWNDPDLDLINQFMYADGWTQVGLNLRNLKRGDGLIFSLLHGKANHVGVYVGNGMFIHHIYQMFSDEVALTPKWTNRVLGVVQHKEVVAVVDGMRPRTNYLTLLPDHVRRKIEQVPQP